MSIIISEVATGSRFVYSRLLDGSLSQYINSQDWNVTEHTEGEIENELKNDKQQLQTS